MVLTNLTKRADESSYGLVGSIRRPNLLPVGASHATGASKVTVGRRLSVGRQCPMFEEIIWVIVINLSLHFLCISPNGNNSVGFGVPGAYFLALGQFGDQRPQKTGPGTNSDQIIQNCVKILEKTIKTI